MRAGLVVMKRIVGINQVKMSDLPLQPLEQFQSAARQGFLFARLPRPKRRADMAMTGIEQNTEILVADFLWHANDFRRLVEGKSGLKLPHHADALVPRLGGCRAKRLRHTLPAKLWIDLFFLKNIRGADGIHTNAVNSKVFRKFHVAFKGGHPGGVILYRNDGKRPQVRRQAGKFKPMVVNFPPEFLALRLGVKLVRVRVRREAAQLDAVKAQLPQLLDDRIEGYRIILIRPKTVGPTPD